MTEERESSFWHWYWIESGRLKDIFKFMLLFSPMIIGIILDVLFFSERGYLLFYTQFGGVMMVVILLISGAWGYIGDKKLEYEAHLRRRD